MELRVFRFKRLAFHMKSDVCRMKIKIRMFLYILLLLYLLSKTSFNRKH